MKHETFDREYFMDGIRTGKSNYENYRWLPDVTIPACQAIAKYLGIRTNDSLLDYGCGPGMYVKAYRSIGITAFGYDVSTWAVTNCEPEVSNFLSCTRRMNEVDWIVAKDVMEHVCFNEHRQTLNYMMMAARKGVLICVPITYVTDGPYVLDVDNKDATHVIKWTLNDWLENIQHFIDEDKHPFVLTAGYRLPGLKEYGGARHNGCAFLTLRRQ